MAAELGHHTQRGGRVMTGSSVQGVVTLLATAVTPAVIAIVCWSPILVSSRLRALFRQLPPTNSVLGSYVLVGLALSLPFLAGSFWAFSQPAGPDAAISNAILDVVVTLAIVYLLCLPVLAGVALPRIGIDWDPASYRASTWTVLVAATGWYVAVFALPLVALAIVFALPT